MHTFTTHERLLGVLTCMHLRFMISFEHSCKHTFTTRSVFQELLAQALALALLLGPQQCAPGHDRTNKCQSLLGALKGLDTFWASSRELVFAFRDVLHAYIRDL